MLVSPKATLFQSNYNLFVAFVDPVTLFGTIETISLLLLKPQAVHQLHSFSCVVSFCLYHSSFHLFDSILSLIHALRFLLD